MKTAQTHSNLIVEQRSLLKKIYSQGENLWKVVIFDTVNREINSSLFKMKDLRENNITLYFHIKDDREQLHGVTAIYLVEPTPDNINLIYNDFEDDLYSSVIIHFSSEPQNHLLSSLAKKLAKYKPAALTKIQKIEYSFLGFYTIARNMAVLPDTNEIINLLSLMKYFSCDLETSPFSCTEARKSKRCLFSRKD